MVMYQISFLVYFGCAMIMWEDNIRRNKKLGERYIGILCTIFGELSWKSKPILEIQILLFKKKKK